jgi:hypothetical protein
MQHQHTHKSQRQLKTTNPSAGGPSLEVLRKLREMHPHDITSVAHKVQPYAAFERVWAKGAHHVLLARGRSCCSPVTGCEGGLVEDVPPI